MDEAFSNHQPCGETAETGPAFSVFHSNRPPTCDRYHLGQALNFADESCKPGREKNHAIVYPVQQRDDADASLLATLAASAGDG